MLFVLPVLPVLSLLPVLPVLSVLFPLLPDSVAGIFTVIVLVALLLPSTVVTVIVQVPFATAVTFPFASTVATFVLLDVHVTLLSVASAGATVAVSCTVSPAFVRVAVSCVKVTPVATILSVYAIAYVENLSVLNVNSPVSLSKIPSKIS